MLSEAAVAGMPQYRHTRAARAPPRRGLENGRDIRDGPYKQVFVCVLEMYRQPLCNQAVLDCRFWSVVRNDPLCSCLLLLNLSRDRLGAKK